MTRRTWTFAGAATAVVMAAVAGLAISQSGDAKTKPPYIANDSHVHLTNYVQHGTDIHAFLRVMGDRVGRATLFGIPLQQTWSARLGEDVPPTYYLQSDAPLYYYSFTDAHIAMAYLSLTKAERARFDPMITGFNPADQYAAEHVKRVLETFPGVFVGIGEFSIHKEFVTAKVAGESPSLEDPALDRLLTFAGEVGLVSLMHCDIDTPFPKPGNEPAYFNDIVKLLARHPQATIIWAHAGVGRIIRPVTDHAKYLAQLLDDPRMAHVMIDLSWSETAKYVVASPEATKIVADLITRHPDRFLFGTDEVSPSNQTSYLSVYRQYQPLWDRLAPDVSEKVRKTNYERVFDQARRRVRAWEQKHVVRPPL